MTIEQALKWGAEQLVASCERPRYEAELLLGYHLQKERIYLATHEQESVEEVEVFRSFIKRRASNEPYEYIVREVSFYDIELYVDNRVLIARPETELLIERVAEIIKRHSIERVIEIGVGSGAICIVLARMFKHLQIVAGDISLDALAVAKQNIAHFGLNERIELVHSDLLESITFDAQMVVSNPPYIADNFKLEDNVAEYEPHSALFGGNRGDELLQKIIQQTKECKIPWLACEMGYDQRESMQQAFDAIGVVEYSFYQDLAGFDRGFLVHFKQGKEQ